MLRKPLLSLLLAIVLGAGFAYGLAHLFVLRYEIGDVYPPYSSLRADPLGTKALADALDELPNVDVHRNFRPLQRLRESGPLTIVYTGVPRYAFWTEQELAAFDSLVAGGSRAIFTFRPVDGPMTVRQEEHAEKAEHEKKEQKIEEEKPESEKKDAKDKKKKDAKEKKDKKDGKKSDTKDSKTDKAKDDKAKDDEDRMKNLVSFNDVSKRWGFEFGYLTAEKAPAPRKTEPDSSFTTRLMQFEDRQAALVEPGGHLESDIPWHSALCFKNLKPQWKVLYMCGTMPVVVERQYGSGSIVLVADTFLVSNEGLRKERHPLLLARLFSGPSKVVFDEESHGLRDNPGIASLARKYRLHGVVVGLILLAIFFVWKNSVRFIPAYEPEFAETDVIAGKESSEGFINLLRRAISPSAIFEACVAEWRKAFAHNPRELAKAEEIWAAEQARPPRQRDAITAYRSLARALTRKK